MGLASRLANLVPTLVLRSPLHPLMSSRYAVLTFRGRRSGKTYHTPVGYCRSGDYVMITTDSPWWRNLAGGQPVTLRLRGRDFSARAYPVDEEQQAVAVLRRLVEAMPSYAKFAHLKKEEGTIPESEFRRVLREGRVAIMIHLDNPGI